MWITHKATQHGVFQNKDMRTVTTTIVGIFYFSLASFLFVLNGVLLMTLLTNKEFKSSTYRVIINMNIACMMLLSVFVVGGVMTVAQTTFNYYLDRILGALVIASWLLYVSLTLALAVDRLITFVCPRSSKFSIATTILTILSWILWFVVLIVLSLPGYRVSYDGGNMFYYWNYTDEPGAQIFLNCEPYYDISVIVMVLFIYMAVFSHLRKMGHMSGNQSSSFKAEMRIFVVAFISFTYETLCVILWFWIPESLGKLEATNIAMNTAWIVEGGMFVTLTLIISTNLRRSVIRTMRKKNKVFVVSHT
ncbi:hypothetical protein QR680_003695 [Steinernema hermaphroditum]|uniref:G-protein coupled receptors family 1 profile domain-containing protein n=1 Tax=Steinernema hermaphroditum TaxID=289476 RepID=A0AA39HM83_9BILA|nr:hypothetical protein QR680_003695 [Steinernema hermaphroditum]